MKPQFSPSLMCMDFLEVGASIETLDTRCDCYHADVMDGHFVPNFALSPDFLRAFCAAAGRETVCHLMVTDPGAYLEPLAKAGVGTLCVHAETVWRDAFRVLQAIRTLGCKTGLVLCPATPLSAVYPLLGHIDRLTVMTVDPGFAGQRFIPEMLDKLRDARDYKREHGCRFVLEADGSCNAGTYRALCAAGTECFVVGTSGLFSLDKDLGRAWEKMESDFAAAVGGRD